MFGITNNKKRRELPTGCLPVFEAFALPLHRISNNKKAHAREICINQLPAHTGVEVEIQSTNADTSSVALSSGTKSCEVFRVEDNDVVASFVNNKISSANLTDCASSSQSRWCKDNSFRNTMVSEEQGKCWKRCIFPPSIAFCNLTTVFFDKIGTETDWKHRAKPSRRNAENKKRCH